VRTLLKIAGGGLIVFIVVAVVQEWQLFAAAWFGSQEPVEIEIQHGERQKANNALRLVLDLTGHLYRSGGDRRFAERIPAGAGVIDEVMADVEYLARNHRVQDQTLESFDVVSVDVLASDQMEIRTRELWDVAVLWAAGGGEAEPRASRLVKGRYLLVKTGVGWSVEGWSFDEAAANGRP
jgi:hypothetical protein